MWKSHSDNDTRKHLYNFPVGGIKMRLSSWTTSLW